MLLCFLCVALSLVFILEQPGSARFRELPLWQIFCDEIAYVSGLRIMPFSALIVLGSVMASPHKLRFSD